MHQTWHKDRFNYCSTIADPCFMLTLVPHMILHDVCVCNTFTACGDRNHFNTSCLMFYVMAHSHLLVYHNKKHHLQAIELVETLCTLQVLRWMSFLASVMKHFLLPQEHPNYTCWRTMLCLGCANGRQGKESNLNFFHGPTQEENDGSNPDLYWTPHHEPWLWTSPLTCMVPHH